MTLFTFFPLAQNSIVSVALSLGLRALIYEGIFDPDFEVKNMNFTDKMASLYPGGR